MVTDRQVGRLMGLLRRGVRLEEAADKAGMDSKTARKYRDSGLLPSQCQAEHDWRTRSDPFAGVWDGLKARLKESPDIEAKTLFAMLQREHPGRWMDGQLRTLQRKLKRWRAMEGPPREVFFCQEHRPGVLGASDFTHMSELRVTIAGAAFDHLIYHFVLTYSNWEAGTICFSESAESLSAGLQNALWELGGVPLRHLSDRMSAAIHSGCKAEEFTRRYQALMDHYGLQVRMTQAGEPHENGDIEQRNHRFKRAVEQALLLRGSRDFASRSEYEAFLREIFAQQNAGRRERLQEEIEVLRPLPARRLEDAKRIEVKVGRSSTIRLQDNVYSVHSRLLGETVQARLYSEHVEVWYAQQKVDSFPRLRGKRQHRINYRHVIDWLVRKPGAFENYRYREDLFPSSHYRMAYDALHRQDPLRGSKEYLRILDLAAKESEAGVEAALRALLGGPEPLSVKAVESLLQAGQRPETPPSVQVADVNLAEYDALASAEEVA